MKFRGEIETMISMLQREGYVVLHKSDLAVVTCEQRIDTRLLLGGRDPEHAREYHRRNAAQDIADRLHEGAMIEDVSRWVLEPLPAEVHDFTLTVVKPGVLK